MSVKQYMTKAIAAKVIDYISGDPENNWHLGVQWTLRGLQGTYSLTEKG